ncbi:hypothetical protein EI555_007789, partial [Monodon monoceros]
RTRDVPPPAADRAGWAALATLLPPPLSPTPKKTRSLEHHRDPKRAFARTRGPPDQTPRPAHRGGGGGENPTQEGRDLAPCQPVPALRPQQARSSRVHMASGVHMAINGPPALPWQGRAPAPQLRSRPLARPAPPQARPSARPPRPLRSGESRGIPGAARDPGAGSADPADPRAPPAHIRRLCTRGRDEQARTGAQARPDSQAGPRPLSALMPGRTLSPQRPEARAGRSSLHSRVGPGRDSRLSNPSPGLGVLGLSTPSGYLWEPPARSLGLGRGREGRERRRTALRGVGVGEPPPPPARAPGPAAGRAGAAAPGGSLRPARSLPGQARLRAGSPGGGRGRLAGAESGSARGFFSPFSQHTGNNRARHPPRGRGRAGVPSAAVGGVARVSPLDQCHLGLQLPAVLGVAASQLSGELVARNLSLGFLEFPGAAKARIASQSALGSPRARAHSPPRNPLSGAGSCPPSAHPALRPTHSGLRLGDQNLKWMEGPSANSSTPGGRPPELVLTILQETTYQKKPLLNRGFKNGSPATKVIVFWKQSCPVRFLITALHLPGSSQDNSKA